MLTESGRAGAGLVPQGGPGAGAAPGRGLGDEEREAFYKALDLITQNLRMLTRDGIPE